MKTTKRVKFGLQLIKAGNLQMDKQKKKYSEGF